MMYALVFLCIKQHTKFEAHGFTNSKDMIGKNFLKGHVTLTTPIRGLVSHRKAQS